MKPLSAAKFLESLKADPGNVPPRIVAMVKPSPDNEKDLLLGPTLGCGPWVEASSDAIAHVVPLTQGMCEDHHHPIAAIYFKKDAAQAQGIFSQMLQLTQGTCCKPGTNTSAVPASMAKRIGGGNGTNDSPSVKCVLIYIPVCWEVPPDPHPDHPYPARPSPVYDCVLIPILICYPV